MKAIIAGTGLMGVPLAYAMSKLGHTIFLNDSNIESLNNAKRKLNSLGVGVKYADTSIKNIIAFYGKPSVIVSAAPFFANYKIAQYALSTGIRYCDLGGDPTTSEKINKLSLQLGVPAFTDLGLAPGLINILAEYYYKHKFFNESEYVESVEMRVGGLPISPVGPLGYARTWSTDGLINEYTGNCYQIKDGHLAVRQALDGLETISLEGIELEAFNTKGGFSHSLQSLYDKGIKQANYKTLRYPGHRDKLKAIVEEYSNNPSGFDEYISSICPITTQDVVYMIVKINDSQYFWKVVYDKNWTAMQKSTAFPAASVASMVAEGVFDNMVKEGHLPGYDCVLESQLENNLQTIGNFPQLFKG